jgi:hypothetical protein
MSKLESVFHIFSDKFLVLGGEQYEAPEVTYLSSIEAFDGKVWSQGKTKVISARQLD